VKIDAALAETALRDQVASVLRCSVLEAAFGVHRLANSTMMRAVKAVSTYRGRDPRDFTLFAFGGNGGIHAAALARELQMTRVVVPPAAGVFSAVGLLLADFEVSESAAFLRPMSTAMLGDAVVEFARLENRVLDELGRSAPVTATWRADLRYAGQAFELTVEIDPAHAGDAELESSIRTAFEHEHRRNYGHVQPHGEIQFVTLRVTGSLPHGGARNLAPPAAANPALESSRQVYFGAQEGLRETPVVARAALGADARPGPLIVEEYGGTTVVPPDASAVLDTFGNIVITFNASHPS
jgi:N-methylhydantoinase A